MPKNIPKQLFLCHSSKDKPFVRKLAADLKELAIEVWLDEFELEPGDSLHGTIAAALESSAYVGVALSKNSVQSKWCQRELEASLAREMSSGSKVILPLLLSKVKVPTFLLDRLYVNFASDHYVGLARITAFIHKITPAEIAPLLVENPPRSLLHVKELLRMAGWDDLLYFDSDDYELIRKILRRNGVRIEGQYFDIVPRSHDGERMLKRKKVKK